MTIGKMITAAVATPANGPQTMNDRPNRLVTESEARVIVKSVRQTASGALHGQDLATIERLVTAPESYVEHAPRSFQNSKFMLCTEDAYAISSSAARVFNGFLEQNGSDVRAEFDPKKHNNVVSDQLTGGRPLDIQLNQMGRTMMGFFRS